MMRLPTLRSVTSSTLTASALCSALLLFGFATSACAQGGSGSASSERGAAQAAAPGGDVPADALFSDFQPSGDFILDIDGERVKDLELFHSERSSAYLLMATGHLSSPLLINPRTGSIDAVSLLKVARRADGGVDLLADASFDTLGRFRLGGDRLTFDYKGKTAELAPKPPLIGSQKGTGLIEHDPSYARKAAAYEPSPSALQALKTESRDVTLQIYFGTWCPVCSRLVPKTIGLEEDLEGSKIDFKYYGLPKQMTSDPVAAEKGIRGVPTGIVLIDGQEVGRLSARELNDPAGSLVKLLGAQG